MDLSVSSRSAISLENVILGYYPKKVPLFAPISLDIPHKSLNVIVGANGSGKSTLLHTIAGTLKPIDGNVFIDNNEISRLSVRKKARLVSLTYTERIYSGGLTVRELVQMGRHPYTGFLSYLSKKDHQIVTNALNDIGISHKANEFLSDISDGERQKAMIARALAQQTPFMLFDEPTNFLDAASRLEILALIHRLVQEKNVTVLLSGHDISHMLNLADNVITVIPENEAPVKLNPVDSDEANQRLNEIFLSRGVHYDDASHDFALST